MLGILFGTICLVTLLSVLRRGRHRRWGYYHHHRHGYGGSPWGHQGRRRRGALRWLTWRLETTHGQDKVLAEALESLQQTFDALRQDTREMAGAAAAVVRAERLDAAAVQGLWRRQDALLAKGREALEQALGRVHEALDDRQRQQIATWLESGARPGCY